MAATKLVVEPIESVSAQTPTPTAEEIQMRAYQLWQSRLRHGIEGTAEQDWAHAEHELTGSKPESSSEQENAKV